LPKGTNCRGFKKGLEKGGRAKLQLGETVTPVGNGEELEDGPTPERRMTSANKGKRGYDNIGTQKRSISGGA